MGSEVVNFAPWIDNMIHRLEHYSTQIDPGTHHQLKAIYLAMSCLKPEDDDDIRQLWIEVQRGSIEDFGDFDTYREEGLVETYEEFEREWKDYYPDEVKWYGFATSRYKEEMFFYFNSKLIFTIKGTAESVTDGQYHNTDMKRFLEWLLYRITEETGKIKQDTAGYNMYLDKHLSYHKRTGRIKRKEYWDLLGKYAVRLDENLGHDRIHTLRKLVDKQQHSAVAPTVPGLSAGNFFRYCEICYDANDYFREHNDGSSPIEKYRRMADGRCGGLTKIDLNSEETFREWYHSEKITGAHPWEICRGGNSTHISLMATENGNAWTLLLDGSSVVRVEETVRMAVALHNGSVPFILHKGEAILRMVTGEDYIGIVPDYIFPRYCHSFFPSEDRIIDFLNLGYEDPEKIIKNAFWYPLKPVLLSS